MATIVELNGVAPAIGERVTVGHGALLEGWTRDAAEEYQKHRRSYLNESRIRG